MAVPAHLKQRKYANPRRNEFAELLSQDLSRGDIMARMALSESGYKAHLRAVRADLGWQAI